MWSVKMEEDDEEEDGELGGNRSSLEENGIAEVVY